MAEQLLVPFRGPGSGVGCLSWGQKGIWQSIKREGQSITMGGVTPLPAGMTVDDAAAVLRFSVSRHESLRTRLRFDPDGSVQQVVSSSGVIPLEVLDAGTEDPEAVAGRVSQSYQTRDFDYVREWPLRMAVIRSGGVLTHAVAIYLHLYIDALGLQVLLADLATMDPASGDAPAPAAAMQPLEQARWQQTPSARRQCEGSLRHLERVLRTVPTRRFPGPVADHPPRYPILTFRSPATRLAVRLISHRMSMDTSPVLLGLFGIALTRMTGSNPFVAMLAVSNRFRPGLAASVSAVAQLSPCMIDLADITLEEAMVRSRRAAVGAYLYAYYDPPQRMALISQITEDRGEPVDTSCFFNDRRQQRDLRDVAVPSGADIRAAAGIAGEFRCHDEAEEIHERLYLSVDDVEDAVVLKLSADNRYFSADRVAELLGGIESVAVDTALDPSASTGIRSASSVVGRA